MITHTRLFLSDKYIVRVNATILKNAEKGSMVVGDDGVSEGRGREWRCHGGGELAKDGEVAEKREGRAKKDDPNNIVS